jgi:hypothetical protein
VISSDHGYRKPDRRLFQFALDGMGVAAENAVYVGNDMHRDIFERGRPACPTVMFESGQGTSAYLDCVPDYQDHRFPRPVEDPRPGVVLRRELSNSQFRQMVRLHMSRSRRGVQ